jgi:catechol 2,3-dioxygenase-like lactoylglutathione lyase family enzyme
MEMKLEVVVLPVTDVDRAKEFYAERLGFHVDVDVQPTEAMRVVQLTPPGSACSISIGPWIVDADTKPAPSARLQLVVRDIEAARARLVENGVEASEVTVLAPGDGGKFVFFDDPDGNGWGVQEFPRSFADAPAGTE